METVVKAASENFVIGENWGTESKFLREQFPLLTNEDLAFEMVKKKNCWGGCRRDCIRAAKRY